MNGIKSIIVKILLSALLVSCALFSVNIGYGGWDTLTHEDQGYANIGQWATAITTAAQFKAFATKTDSLPTDKYYLANDINMSSTSWAQDSNNNAVVFRGTLYGNNKTISNLTISSNNSNYMYLGIFPIMEGGSVFDLKLNGVYLTLGSTGLNGSNIRAGLIAGNVIGQTNTIKNITITNAGVRATNTAGAGGLVGSVTGATTVLNIQNVKATNLKVFNKASNTGGVVGAVSTAGARINVYDIDTQGEVFSYNSSSHTGGIVGNIINGGIADIRRVVTEQTSRNTLETNSTYYNVYSRRYLGGIVGYTDSASSNVTLNTTFFTGALYPSANNRRTDIGTATGRYTSGKAPSLTNAFYARVQFRSSSNTVVWAPAGTASGQMATLANATTNALPTAVWWSGYLSLLNAEGTLWAHDGTTNKPYLIR